MTVETRRRAHRDAPPGPWQPPTFSMPMSFCDVPDEWRQLGELRGRRWWLSKWGELEEDDRLTLVNAVTADKFIGPLLIELDDIGREAGRRLRPHPPGTFAQRASPKPKAPARELADVVIVGSHLVPLVAGRPIDALAELSTFATVHGHAERRPIRGAGAVLAHLRGRRGQLLDGLASPCPAVALPARWQGAGLRVWLRRDRYHHC